MKANGVVAMHIYLHEFMNIWSDLISRSLLGRFSLSFLLLQNIILNIASY